MADGQALRVMVVPRARQQGLGRPAAQFEESPLCQPSGYAAPPSAVSIGRTQTALGAFYRRLAARIGKAKVVTATARKLAILFYNAWRFGLAYADPGASYYEDRYRRRVIDNLQRRARHFGFTLVAAPAAK